MRPSPDAATAKPASRIAMPKNSTHRAPKSGIRAASPVPHQGKKPSNQGSSCLIKASAFFSNEHLLRRTTRWREDTGKGGLTHQPVHETRQSRQKPLQSCMIKAYQGIRKKRPLGAWSLELHWSLEVGRWELPPRFGFCPANCVLSLIAGHATLLYAFR